jgi:hypothetical protein
MDRLTLCHIAAGKTEDAVRVAEESQRKQARLDPTVTAFSKFYFGNALWHNGQVEEALEQWNAPSGTCSAPMALCKEPGKEHNEHLQLMANAGVNFDSYDEQDFTALDYAVLSGSLDASEAIQIVEEALRKALSPTSEDITGDVANLEGTLCIMWSHEGPNRGWCAQPRENPAGVAAHRPRGASPTPGLAKLPI